MVKIIFYILITILLVILFFSLKKKNIFTCGTIRSNRKYLPDLLPDKSLKRGDFDYSVSNDNIALFKWMDNKPVYLISSLHSPNDTHAVKRKLKDGSTTMIPCPDVLISYNNNMNNVDVFDQLKAAYGMNRKSRK